MPDTDTVTHHTLELKCSCCGTTEQVRGPSAEANSAARGWTDDLCPRCAAYAAFGGQP